MIAFTSCVLGSVLTVLIGPPACGKTTVGALVARETSRPFVDADEHGAAWYETVGWSRQRLRDRTGEVGFERAHREWEIALTAAVEGLVHAHRDAVLALGAGHTHVTDPALFDRVAAALAGADQVVLLLPSADRAQARSALLARCRRVNGHTWQVDGVDWLRRWLDDGRDEALATDVVITAGERLEGTARRVAALRARPRAPRSVE